MHAVVVDYDGGNLASAANALRHAAARAGIDATVAITADPAAILAADRIVLPGQGAFAACARGLAASGLTGAIETATASGTPFLGICVGMQLMARVGREHEVTQGLGWIAGEVVRLDAPGLPLPHMGWNVLAMTPHPLLDGLPEDAHAYFVHSYALADGDPADILARTTYGHEIPAVVARRNRAGTQFHVEKSQDVGLRILANFLRWTP